MIQLSAALVFIAAILAFRNWRTGFALCVLTALLQDPARKLAADQPVYFVVFVGFVFAAAWLGAAVNQVDLLPGRILGWRNFVSKPFLLLYLLALLQAFNSLLSYGNPIMAGIGLMSYFAPIPAVALAYRFALSRGEGGVLRWMRFYVIVATIALTTVYMEYAGVNWPMFGEVGGGVYISGAGLYYKGNSGLFRAAEIAAWHAATVSCFAFVLFWGRRFSPPKFLAALVFLAFLLGIGALTGRRKMVIELAIFLSAYFCLVGWFQRGSAKMAVVTALMGVVTYSAAIGLLTPDPGDGLHASERVSGTNDGTFGKYSERATTVFADLPSRVYETGLGPVKWAIESYGWFGAGLGVGSQGTQHFGVTSSAAAEGGLGKLTVEMGVPGLILGVWLFISFLRYVWRVLDVLSKLSKAHANVGYGLVAFMLANMAAFAVAIQAYGDLFILLTLGWSFGFLLALPALADPSRRLPPAGTVRRAPQEAADPAPAIA